MRDGEPNMYAGLCAARNTTIQVLWSGMQAFLVFNAVAVPIAFGAIQEENVKLLISIFGFFMHLGLTIKVWYSTRLLKFWDNTLTALEELDQDSDSGTRVPVFSNVNFRKHREWPRLQAYYIPFAIGMMGWAYEAITHFSR